MDGAKKARSEACLLWMIRMITALPQVRGLGRSIDSDQRQSRRSGRCNPSIVELQRLCRSELDPQTGCDVERVCPGQRVWESTVERLSDLVKPQVRGLWREDRRSRFRRSEAMSIACGRCYRSRRDLRKRCPRNGDQQGFL